MTQPADEPFCSRCGTEPLSLATGLCPRCVATQVFGKGLPSPSVRQRGGRRLRYFGDFELQKELARGAKGVVYRARQVSLDRLVAVKLLRESVLPDGKEADRFRLESQAAVALRHPHIVAIHETGEHDGVYYLAMELIVGSDLAARTQAGPFAVKLASALMEKVADAVQHAHQCGLLHRSLKPSKVLVDDSGEPHVADFSLAQRMDRLGSSPPLPLTGQIGGAFNYQSPEQALGRALNARSDVYGLGALTYFLLTGRAPFSGDCPAVIVQQVAPRQLVAPRSVNPIVPSDLEDVCLKALAKDPRSRYATAAEFAADLRRFREGEPVHA